MLGPVREVTITYAPKHERSLPDMLRHLGRHFNCLYGPYPVFVMYDHLAAAAVERLRGVVDGALADGPCTFPVELVDVSPSPATQAIWTGLPLLAFPWCCLGHFD